MSNSPSSIFKLIARYRKEREREREREREGGGAGDMKRK